jgi:hypothetical protein
MARATLALLDEEDEPVGARRWLIYPPLLLIYVVFALALFVLAPAPILGAADPAGRAQAAAWFPDPFWAGLLLIFTLVVGIWWTVLGLLFARFTAAVRSVFWPFADWFERRHGMRIAKTGAAVASIAGAALAAVIWS